MVCPYSTKPDGYYCNRKAITDGAIYNNYYYNSMALKDKKQANSPFKSIAFLDQIDVKIRLIFL